MASKKQRSGSNQSGAPRRRKAVPAGFGGRAPADPLTLLDVLEEQLAELQQAAASAGETLAALRAQLGGRKAGSVFMRGPTGNAEQE